MATMHGANFLFRNARIIDPAQGMDTVADLLIRDGQLVEIRPHLQISPDWLKGLQEIDLSGKWIVPGLLDMHVHLREPGQEYKETIASGTAAAVAGGYVAVAAMPNTSPVNDCAAVTEFILERARKEGSCRVFPVGAISKGLAGEHLAEYGELREAGAVAVSDDGRPVMNSLLMRRALEYARAFDLLVISHAEDLELSRNGLMNEGPVATVLGLRGIPNAAEDVMVARDVLLAELTESRLHIAHVSTRGAVELIRHARQRGVPVTAETAPQYFSLMDEALMTFDTVFKVNPPLRSAADREAIKQGLADGTIDAIATDHAPHSTLEKDLEFEYAACGMIGLESAAALDFEPGSRRRPDPSRGDRQSNLQSGPDSQGPAGSAPARSAGRPYHPRSGGNVCSGLLRFSLQESQLPLSWPAGGGARTHDVCRRSIGLFPFGIDQSFPARGRL